MTTAFRSDLACGVYEAEIALIVANSLTMMKPTVISCPKKNCGVQYRLLVTGDAPIDFVKSKAAVETAMQQQYCPYHPPKIELD
jgi:hypothetical protein